MTNKQRQCGEAGIWSDLFNPGYVIGVFTGSAVVIATLSYITGW